MAYLCWERCLEVYGMIVSVNVGILYRAILQFSGVLWMVTSRKLMWLFVSHSNVNLSLGSIVLKSVNMFWASVWLVSYMINMSSTYLKYFMILCLSDS